MNEKRCVGYPGNKDCENTPTVKGEGNAMRCNGCQAGLLAWVIERDRTRQRHTVGTPEWEADQRDKGNS